MPCFFRFFAAYRGSMDSGQDGRARSKGSVETDKRESRFFYNTRGTEGAFAKR